MVYPGVSIASFAALSASLFPLIPMCAETLCKVIIFLGNEALLVYYISDLILDVFFSVILNG